MRMSGAPANYLLTSGIEELERLRLQARVWEPETERWLDEVGVRPGWRCLDLGCGAMGILGPLAKRAGPTGGVVGLDRDPVQLAGARQYIAENSLSNVEIIEGDAYALAFPEASFDFVHARFVLAPVGRDADLLQQMQRIAKPGGIVALQEPDTAGWGYHPSSPTWDKLKFIITTAFRLGGGDIDAGCRTFNMLRELKLDDVRLRAAVLALHNNHPYMRLPIQFATSLRTRLLRDGVIGETELDETVAAFERIAADPETICISFVVTQAWGRKPLQ
jgi:ubiquinone/menaquinone biosynthesis C-methylase UbiE